MHLDIDACNASAGRGMTNSGPVREYSALLPLAQEAALEAARLATTDNEYKNHRFSPTTPREVKARADVVLEADILTRLKPTGLPILSEESGFLPGQTGDGAFWIVDPLDGTVNFVRDLGQSAVSIALWQDARPIFGVLCLISSLELAWGGPELGANFAGRPVTVSDIAEVQKAVLCTGFPARLDLEDEEARERFFDRVRPFAKVRMLGSAALSLLQVARGAADAYCEDEIMLWDVAAGLALVAGAGGRVRTSPGRNEWALDVVADNGRTAPAGEWGESK